MTNSFYHGRSSKMKRFGDRNGTAYSQSWWQSQFTLNMAKDIRTWSQRLVVGLSRGLPCWYSYPMLAGMTGERENRVADITACLSTIISVFRQGVTLKRGKKGERNHLPLQPRLRWPFLKWWVICWCLLPPTFTRQAQYWWAIVIMWLREYSFRPHLLKGFLPLAWYL